jgi:hypothetical protein
MRQHRSRQLLRAGSALVESSSGAPREDRRLAPEAPDRAVDAKEELPCRLGNRREALQAAARMAAPEHDDRAREEDQRPADQPQRLRRMRSPELRPDGLARGSPRAPLSMS